MSDFVEKITNKKDIKTEIERDIRTLDIKRHFYVLMQMGACLRWNIPGTHNCFFVSTIKSFRNNASKTAVPINVPKRIFKKESQKLLDRSKKLTYLDKAI